MDEKQFRAGLRAFKARLKPKTAEAAKKGYWFWRQYGTPITIVQVKVK